MDVDDISKWEAMETEEMISEMEKTLNILGLEELMRERVLHIRGTGGAEAAVSAHSSAIFVGAVLRCRFRCCSWL